MTASLNLRVLQVLHADADGTTAERVSVIRVVDLASTGSRSRSSSTGVASFRDLSSITNVILALANNANPEQKRCHVSYRDSYLTRLLWVSRCRLCDCGRGMRGLLLSLPLSCFVLPFHRRTQAVVTRCSPSCFTYHLTPAAIVLITCT